jgi:hypothetical protein
MSPTEQITNYELYFDHHDDKSAAEMIESALVHYVGKHPGELPDVCLVPANETWTATEVDGIPIKPSSAVIGGHFMLAQIVPPEQES